MTEIECIADEREILRIRRTWGFCRDQGDSETMKTLFHPDATISISWYAENVNGFIEGSKKVLGLKRPGTRVKHWFGNYRVTIHNERAFLEIDMEVRGRDYIGDHLFDLKIEGRFLTASKSAVVIGKFRNGQQYTIMTGKILCCSVPCQVHSLMDYLSMALTRQRPRGVSFCRKPTAPCAR